MRASEFIAEHGAGWGRSDDEDEARAGHEAHQRRIANEKKFEDKAKEDMAASKSVAWFLDKTNGAGQKWSIGTETWFDAVEYMKTGNRIKRSIGMGEGSKENASALVNSGRADASGKKSNSDSKEHKAVRTPDTTYSKKKGNIGANDGFVG